ncbi:glycosyltransferase family 2 protein [Salinibacter ruber]|uniref:glycosyltransferase family 2 protein n=1 Tax=Salinibacter ruber TaxID=146919 RepID=UPI002167A7FF|nr:glycosyltransferase family 2 protein [Salinibacter ruber]MCS4101405.1 glycosyltransferase involved in cell wall biosynthesis [Salinibacter ruber]
MIDKLGVVAISYNEENDMVGFMEHLRDRVGEIVIVDDESDDDTAEIAKSMGENTKVITQSMDDNKGFSGQRNKGIDIANSEWLLHMDIDERVTPHLYEEIAETIENTDKYAFRYRRLNFFLHRPMRGGGWQSWNRPHLAKRGKHKFKKKIHETCVVDGGKKKIGQLDNKIWHLNDKNYEERLEKSFRYCIGVADQLQNNGVNLSIISVFVEPLKEFVKKYFWYFGFRDGRTGIISALHSAGATFRTYALLWDRMNRIERSKIEEKLKDKWDNEI